MAQHRRGRGAGQRCAQAVGPVDQRVDHGPLGPPAHGQPARDRVGRVGGGERGLQVGEELAPARAEHLPADQPQQLRGRRHGVDLGEGGAELPPLGR
ncbi:MAG TPA: hypothetical protein VHS79_03410 [Actinomycetes bacterium]|nr:hypothetical protein [Actinomycetes bacterium]